MGLYDLLLYHIRRIKTEKKAKVVAVVWGDVLECHTNHLAARMNELKFLGKHPFWQGLWFGMARTG